MADLFKSKENEFYIQLKEERFYIPGEDISGDVILDLQKASKTNNIKVTLEGTATIGGRTLTLFTTSVLVAESLDGQKSHYLEAHTHRFPFRITIPSAKTHKIPSTLEIPKLLKVSYRLMAIYNKAFTLEKFCPTTSVSVNILEDINVERAEYAGDQKLERELLLTNEKERKVKVTAIVKKRAAVKGDVIPVSIKIEHIGVMVRDKAITAQLLRSVYYGKNRSEIVGPKVLREVTSDITILGPINFTETFDLKLPIPPNICPTVAESGEAFKIEYFLRLRVNLNEENPLYKESENDIAIFNAPFIIGTYPKLAFNIDDDDEEEEEQINEQNEEINASEMDQVVETMKNMELESDVPATVASPAPSFTSVKETQEQDKITGVDSIAANDTTLNDTASSPPLDNTTVTNSQANQAIVNNTPGSPAFGINSSTYPPNNHIIAPPKSPPMPTLVQRQDSIASSLHRTDTTSSTHSIGLERHESMNNQGPYPFNNNGLETANNNSSNGAHTLGRQESVRWVANQGDPIPTSIPSPQHIPSAIHTNENHPFAMPTPVMNTFPLGTSPPSNCTNYHYNTPQYDPYSSYPAPPSLPVPQQHQFPTAGFNNGYPQPQYPYNGDPYYNNHMGGFPLPQPDPMYPPPPPKNDNNGYVSMPSHFSYQQQNQPYPYYKN